MKRTPRKSDNKTLRGLIIALCLCFVVVMVVRPKLDARRQTVVASGGAALPSIIKNRWP